MFDGRIRVHGKQDDMCGNCTVQVIQHLKDTNTYKNK